MDVVIGCPFPPGRIDVVLIDNTIALCHIRGRPKPWMATEEFVDKFTFFKIIIASATKVFLTARVASLAIAIRTF